MASGEAATKETGQLPVVPGTPGELLLDDIPDGFFSDFDFDLPPPVPLTSGDRSAVSPLSHGMANGPDRRERNVTGQPIPTIPYMGVKHEGAMPRVPAPSSMSPPQCVVPQASKADLMAEKGRISMEICDLMEMIESGQGSATTSSKLTLLKARRYV